MLISMTFDLYVHPLDPDLGFLPPGPRSAMANTISDKGQTA